MHLWIYTLRIDKFHGGNRRFNDALSSVNRILYVEQCANRICLLLCMVYAVVDLSIYNPHALEATNGHRIRLLWKLLCTFANVALRCWLDLWFYVYYVWIVCYYLVADACAITGVITIEITETICMSMLCLSFAQWSSYKRSYWSRFCIEKSHCLLAIPSI